MIREKIQFLYSPSGIEIYSVNYAGDLNADGIDDFAVSVPGDTDTFNQEPYGTVYIIYGKMENFADIDLGTFNDSMGFKIQGSPTNILDLIPSSALGDVNNDGFDDFLLGVRETLFWVTKAFIIFGQKDRRSNVDLAASENLLLTLNCTMYYFFGTFMKAGDLNNDGYNDILIGATYEIYGLLGSNCNEYTDCNSPMPSICYASKGCDCINEGMMMQDLACVSSCSPGYYQAADYTCKICSVNCKECSSNPLCETCFEDYLMQDSLCVSACSTGYTQMGSICQPSGTGDTNETRGIQLLLIIMGSAVGGGVLVITVLIAGSCYLKRKKKAQHTNGRSITDSLETIRCNHVYRTYSYGSSLSSTKHLS